MASSVLEILNSARQTKGGGSLDYTHKTNMLTDGPSFLDRLHNLPHKADC